MPAYLLLPHQTVWKSLSAGGTDRRSLQNRCSMPCLKHRWTGIFLPSAQSAFLCSWCAPDCTESHLPVPDCQRMPSSAHSAGNNRSSTDRWHAVLIPVHFSLPSLRIPHWTHPGNHGKCSALLLEIPEVMLHKEFPLFRTAHRYSSCQGYSFRGLSAVQQSLVASFLSIFLPRRGTDLL